MSWASWRHKHDKHCSNVQLYACLVPHLYYGRRVVLNAIFVTNSFVVRLTGLDLNQTSHENLQATDTVLGLIHVIVKSTKLLCCSADYVQGTRVMLVVCTWPNCRPYSENVHLPGSDSVTICALPLNHRLCNIFKFAFYSTNRPLPGYGWEGRRGPGPPGQAGGRW